MKYLLFLILLVPLMFLNCINKNQVSTKESYHDSDTVIVENFQRFNLDDNIDEWYYLDPMRKYMNVIYMSDISNGNLRFIVTDPNDKMKTDEEAFQIVKDVVKCVDSSGYIYYKEYNQDVRIGSVLLGCMLKNKFD